MSSFYYIAKLSIPVSIQGDLRKASLKKRLPNIGMLCPFLSVGFVREESPYPS